MNLKEPDVFGIVTERAKQRETFAKHIQRRAEAVFTNTAIQSMIDRAVDERVKALVDQAVERRARERAEEVVNAAKHFTGPQVRDVIELVCAVTETPVDALLGRRQDRRVAWPRHFATYMLRRVRKDLSYPGIAKALHRKDHTTSIASMRRFELIRDEELVVRWLTDERIVAVLEQYDTDDKHVFLRTLTPEEAAAIRTDPRSHKIIADDYGISSTHVGRIKSGECWKEAA